MGESEKCARCGTNLSPHAPAGHCSQCLLQLALDAGTPLAGTAPEIALPAEKPGDHIGRYELLRQIGEGGCGMVYLARQETPLRREVALKVIKLGMDTRQVIGRFEAERQALALMDHPGIAKVLDAGATVTGRPFFVMELVRGIPITRFCDEHNLTTRQRLELFIQVCRAAQHAHQKGVIHRDLKPANILVADNGGIPDPKIIDFGIAKATTGQTLTDKTIFTAFEQFIGTPDYMSPEQALLGGPEVDTRTDIYSLGVLLYELLTGTTPLQLNRRSVGGYDEIRRIIRQEEPPCPSTKLGSLDTPRQIAAAKSHQSTPAKLRGTLRGDLDWIVMKALEKDPARRFQTVDALAVDLRSFLDDEPVTARPPAKLYRLKKTIHKHRLIFGFAGVMILILILGVTTSFHLLFQENEALQRVAVSESLAKKEALRAAAVSLDASNAESALHLLMTKHLSTEESLNAAQAEVAKNEAHLEEARAELARIIAAQSSSAGLSKVSTSSLTLIHKEPVKSSHFSPNGESIVTSSGYQTVCSWDARADRLLWIVRADESLLRPTNNDERVDAEFSPDGRRVIAVALGISFVLNAETGRILAGPIRQDGRIDFAHFSPEGKRVLTVSSDWDPHHGTGNGSWSGDGGKTWNKTLPSPPGVNAARVWDAQTGDPLTPPMCDENSLSGGGQFSPDGRYIYVAGGIWDAQSGMRLTDRPPGLPRRSPTSDQCTPRGQLVSAKLSPDGKRAVTVAKDAGKLPSFYKALSGSTTNWGEGVTIWRLPTASEVVKKRVHLRLSPTTIGSAADEMQRRADLKADSVFAADEINLAAFVNRIKRHSDPMSAFLWKRLSNSDQTTLTNCRPSETSDGRVIHILNQLVDGPDLFDREAFRGISLRTETIDVIELGLPHSAFAQYLNRLLLEDAYPLELTRRQLIMHPGDWVSTAQFSPDGKLVLMWGGDMAQVWDAQSGQPVSDVWKHGGNIVMTEFSPDSRRVLTACADGIARVWDLPPPVASAPAR